MVKKTGVPTYKLYGEEEAWPTPDIVHCESIASRSRLHGWTIKPHQHSGLLQILYLKIGEASFQLDGTQEAMKGGTVLVIPQNFIHGYKFSPDSLGYVLTVAYPFVHKLTETMEKGMGTFSHPFSYMPGSNDKGFYFATLFEAFVQEYRGTSAHRNLLLENLLSAIVILLARHVEESDLRETVDSKDNLHFIKFTTLIEQWYDQHHPLSRYANEIGITIAHLNRLCRHLAKRSPLELIHERLLLEAKRNLIYTSMTISELSYAIGFSDPAYFTRFFTRATGESPRKFRGRAEELRTKHSTAESLMSTATMPRNESFWY